MKYLKLIGLMALLAVSLCACSNRLTSENLLKIKNGMSETQVKEILGSPNRVETGEMLGIRGTTYYYENGSTRIKVVFVNDSVMTKDGSFN